MKEYPILFNAESVKAILSGQKTQTRRVMRPQPVLENGVWRWKPRKGWDVNVAHINPSMSPYGTFGDHLWVKETWRQGGGGGNLDGSGEYALIKYRASATVCRGQDEDVTTYAQEKKYPPDGVDHSKSGLKWRSSRYMPRWASRITLEVLGAKVERAYDITLDGLIAEGCPAEYLPENCNGMEHAAFGWFVHLWNGINQKRGFGFDTNCWVWAVEFKLL